MKAHGATGINPGAPPRPKKGSSLTMKRIARILVAATTLAGAAAFTPQASGHADDEAAAASGIKLPAGYRDWKLISVAHEAGSLNDLRAILGNDAAIGAYRKASLPFPDGAIIVRLAWTYTPSEETTRSSAAISPSSPERPQMSS
jgi:hypothetical protein